MPYYFGQRFKAGTEARRRLALTAIDEGSHLHQVDDFFKIISKGKPAREAKRLPYVLQ